MLLLSDPRVAAVAVAECGERLVDLRSTFRCSDREADGAGLFTRVREGVARRLARASASLPTGVELLVVECWRSPARQAGQFAAYQRQVRSARPDLGPAGLRAAVSAYIAPVEVAPHPTGAAVDLTLCDATGRELDLGTAVNATPLESSNACHTSAFDIPQRARVNRDLLVEALGGAGLVNYPTEWWHWSFGDRYWAAVTDADAAIYGPVTAEEVAAGAPGASS
ncbi:MAG TPA: M15 family metallopeptidase [Mycobacteriales bacterium]|nr:M15 family metallopeptidase [Mycobacteriales bacterium]